MRRLLGFVLVLGSVVLVAPAASAAPMLTLTPSSLSIVEGSSVTLRGSASGVRIGSVVRLQRRASSGWVTVSERVLTEPRSYAFTVHPRRGLRVYRALVQRRGGQQRAVSSLSTITVHWRPVIRLTTTNPDQYTVAVQGVLVGLPHTTLIEQRRYHPAGSWVPVRTIGTDAYGVFSDRYSDGTYELRYLLPASGLRLTSASSSVEVTGPDALTHQVEPNGSTPIYGEHEAVAIKAQAGQQIYLAITGPESTFADGLAVVAPNGAAVGASFHAGADTSPATRGTTGTFHAPVAGWYTLVIGQSSGEVTASVPVVVRTNLDGTGPGPGPLLRGQPVDLTFAGTAGDVISDGTPEQCVHETMFAPDGSVTQAFRQVTAYQGGAWLLAASGQHRLRVTPCDAEETISSSLDLHRGAVGELALDGSVDVATADQSQAAVAEIQLQPGQRFLPAVNGGWDGTGMTVLAPDGTSARDVQPASNSVVATQAGTYRIVYFRPYAASGPVGFSAGTPHVTPSTLDPKKPLTLTTTLPRDLGVSFGGQAGQVVSSYTSWASRDSADEILIGPDGRQLSPTYDLARRAWRLPADGTYTLLHASRAGGDISALTATPGPVLAAGGTTRMTVADPSRTVIGHFTATAGQHVTLGVVGYTFHTYDSALGDFTVGVVAPSGFEPGELNGPAQEGRTTSFDAIESGVYEVVLQGTSVDSTGSVDLDLTVQ